jgi:methylmalonyl-CoA mutase N-terminal domain/subunit
MAETDSGIPVAPVYGPADAGMEPGADLAGPGAFPFTRGVYPDMYRGRVWTMRQYAGFGTAEQTNERYNYLLEQGTTGLSVAFDLPSQMGYDSDHAMATGEVGRVGVAIDSLDDMRALFQGIPLDSVSTSMTINSTAAILLAMYVAVGDEQGVPRSALAGTVQNDILKEYVARGTYIYPVSTSRPRYRGGSSWRPSLRACRSSSRLTTTSWKRWPSSGPPVASGRGSCESGTALRTVRAVCGSTRRRVAPRSRPSSP